MSSDIFLQCFRDRAPATFPRAVARQIFSPGVEADPEFWRVAFADGGGADIYLDAGDIRSLMFNHCGGGAFFDALFTLARRTQSVIFRPAAGPSAVVTDLAVLPHLPPTFSGGLGPVRVVRSGAEIAACIGGRMERVPA